MLKLFRWVFTKDIKQPVQYLPMFTFLKCSVQILVVYVVNRKRTKKNIRGTYFRPPKSASKICGKRTKTKRIKFIGGGKVWNKIGNGQIYFYFFKDEEGRAKKHAFFNVIIYKLGQNQGF